MTTETTICNLALAHLGDERIGSLTDDSEAARACNAVYISSRDALTRSHPWNFAIERANLAAESISPSWGWDEQFVLPSDPYCLRVLEVDGYKSYEWVVEGRKLLGNFSSANIRYIKREIDPAQFDSLFSMALAAKIAETVAVRLTGNSTIKEGARRMFDDAMRTARTTDGQEGMVEVITSSFLTDVRLLQTQLSTP